LNEHEAKLFTENVKKGSILIGVEAHDDRVDKAKQALESCGGENVC
jgi:hypothetical protein